MSAWRSFEKNYAPANYNGRMSVALPLLLTPGDPLGIGPEITVKLLHARCRAGASEPIVVVGHGATLAHTAQGLGLPWPPPRDTAGWLSFVDIAGDAQHQPGAIAYQALETAVSMLGQGQGRALVTGPISKANLRQSGLPASGHTEILQALAQRHWPQQHWQADMLFCHRAFRVLLLTRHVALGRVGQALHIDGVAKSVTALVSFLQQRAGLAAPCVAMLGVNPHAGELGGDAYAGLEEHTILQPALAQVRATCPDAVLLGPLPADAAFRGLKVDSPAYDAYVAPYHDQGLIPMKLVAGFSAVNVTIGLPFLRTSVSHGTAPDIVGQGLADPASLEAALAFAHTHTAPTNTQCA